MFAESENNNNLCNNLYTNGILTEHCFYRYFFEYIITSTIFYSMDNLFDHQVFTEDVKTSGSSGWLLCLSWGLEKSHSGENALKRLNNP